MYALKTRQYERPSSILANSKINLEMSPSLSLRLLPFHLPKMSNRRYCLIKHQILRSCTAVNIDYVFFTQYNTEKYFLEAANENIASPDLRPQYKDR